MPARTVVPSDSISVFNMPQTDTSARGTQVGRGPQFGRSSVSSVAPSKGTASLVSTGSARGNQVGRPSPSRRAASDAGSVASGVLSEVNLSRHTSGQAKRGTSSLASGASQSTAKPPAPARRRPAAAAPAQSTIFEEEEMHNFPVNNNQQLVRTGGYAKTNVSRNDEYEDLQYGAPAPLGATSQARSQAMVRRTGSTVVSGVQSQAMVHRSGSTVVAESPQPQGEEMIQERRFVPLNTTTCPPRLFDKIKYVFQVKSCKVDEWLKDDLIRLDRLKWKHRRTMFAYDIEPLLKQSQQKDIERWNGLMKECDATREMEGVVGGTYVSHNDFDIDCEYCCRENRGCTRSSQKHRQSIEDSLYGRRRW